MKWLVAVAVLACSFLGVSAAHASEPRGFEASVSLGYSAPFGSVDQTFGGDGSDPAGDLVLPSELNKWFSAAVPLRVAAGWRHPYVFVGATFEYAWTQMSTSPGSACSPCDGVGSDVIVGPRVDVHLLPAGAIDPWFGSVFGIESASFNGVVPNQGGFAPRNESVAALGWIATWQVGVDLKLADHLRGGPFLGFAYGHWLGGENSEHEWASAGLRLVFDSSEIR